MVVLGRALGIASLGFAAIAGAQIYQGPNKAGHPLINFVVTQGFGDLWSENSKLLHTGVDLAAPKGNFVFAVKGGKVVKTGSLGSSSSGMNWGQYVIVQNDDGTASGYLHVAPLVTKGAVSVGDRIGTVYRDHLHLNLCRSAKGCQHGAFPNPTFPSGSLRDYYRRPVTR